MTIKINNLFVHRRNKRGLINGLGNIIKAITGNLDSEDAERYEKLFEKINNNQKLLQKQNLETIKLNKEMIDKFNKQLENIKYNELILESRIKQINQFVQETLDWKTITLIKSIFNQLILLTINLNEIINEIETSLTFCNLNKVHSSIITLKELKDLIDQINNGINFWEITSQITSHCKLENNKIEYLLEIPEYQNKPDNKLLQVTPIPIINQEEMFMLDETKGFFLQNNNQLYIITECDKINTKFLL